MLQRAHIDLPGIGMRRSRRGVATVALFAAVAILTGLLSVINPLSAPSASAAPGDPFDPADPYVYIAQDDPTRLYKSITDPSGTVSFVPEGPAQPFSYNALAYNTANNYLYGIVVNSQVAGFPNNSFIRIGQGGVATRLGAAPAASVMATFGPGGGYYMVDGNVIRRLNPANGAQVSSVAMTFPIGNMTAGGGADITFKDGYFWSMGFGHILRINPATGAVSRYAFGIVLPSSGIPTTDQAGAAWTFGNGNLGFSYNGSGRVYQIAVSNVTAATPTFSLVSTNVGPNSSNNDGAASPGLPTDFAVVKSAPAVFDAGQTITYTLTVTNNGPGNSSGWSLTDVLPAALSNPTTTTPGCSIAGRTVTCLGGRTLVGETTTITIQATAPEAAVCITNTGTVTPNETDPDPSNNTSSVQSCGSSVIGLVKSVSSIDDVNGNGITDEGDEIHYEFEVSNGGTVDLTDVAVSDPLIGAVTCSASPLSPGTSTTCTGDAPHVITADDAVTGEVRNTAVASALPQGGTARVESAPSSAVVPVAIAPGPALTVVKTADVTTVTRVGQVVTYTFLVTNTGGTELTDIAIDEGAFSGRGELSAITCAGSGTLQPGEQTTCTATYVVVAADLTGEPLANTATATALPPGGGDPIASPPSTSRIDTTPGGSLALTGSTVDSTGSLIAGGVLAAGLFLAFVARRRRQISRG